MIMMMKTVMTANDDADDGEGGGGRGYVNREYGAEENDDHGDDEDNGGSDGTHERSLQITTITTQAMIFLRIMTTTM
ncbi:hypothetical protein DPMN_185743 [Dreissena polymorpha]|uniref:Uncharacterized protein n=1 Tax=Dreissena polymorpha TaxID=45954 RepID=A0A9D4I7K3_DREPO|nr:hypothetical protein DPMN_185743 [Dreissena polymorpha]